MLNFELCHALNIRYPIIQAPMAGVSTPELAAAVSNAGGLGSLGIGALCTDEAAIAINTTRQLTTQPFNVNVFCHTPASHKPELEQHWLEQLSPHFARFGAKPPQLSDSYLSFQENEALFTLLLDTRPAVVSFHFGLPATEKIKALQAVGCTIFASVTNVAEAHAAHRAGIDVLVAQGIEAGGHRGMFNPYATDEQLSTMVLLQRLRRQGYTRLIAAGGLMDGVAIRAALLLGAHGVQMGTAFMACPETAISSHYRHQLQHAAHMQLHTTLSRTLSGRPARGLPHPLNTLEHHAMPDYPHPYAATKALAAYAAAHGHTEYAVAWAGQGVQQIRIMPAAELMACLVSEAELSPAFP